MDEELSKTIRKNIYNLIQERNMNQRSFAASVSVSESAVGKWVLGKTMPRMGMIQKIADIYGINKTEILEDKGSKFRVSSKKQNLLKRVESMNEETIDKINKFLELI